MALGLGNSSLQLNNGEKELTVQQERRLDVEQNKANLDEISHKINENKIFRLF